MENIAKYFENYLEKNLAVKKIQELVNSSPGEKLFHIDVYGLADTWGIQRRELLNEFIRGVKFGIFSIQWEFHCPSCGGVARESLRLKDFREEDHCALCNIDFKNILDENIEVFFSINENLKPIPEEIKAAYFNKIMASLQKTKTYQWKNPGTIKGIDCINNLLFREILGTDNLPLDQSLEIKHSTILFTDIKGSTTMYERLGDAKAYRLVREHFVVLFENISARQGVPIKTIGDAVMGVFSKNSDAMEAALNALRHFRELNLKKLPEERIEVKIGIHSGPVIAVTLNNRLDYFGTTVNIAARIQRLAKPNEIFFSDIVFSQKDIRQLLKKNVSKVKKFQVNLKGLAGKFIVYGALGG
jgi:class 3 adenylate cyclase